VTNVTGVTHVTMRIPFNLRRHARHAVTCENFSSSQRAKLPSGVVVPARATGGHSKTVQNP
jgi:hypothetical protein